MARRVSLVVVLLAAWALVGSDRPPLPLLTGDAVAGPVGRWDNSADLPKNGEKPTHDLSALRIFTKVILYVKDNYVDPKRVKPKEMMVSALEYVEKTVPEVMVDGSAESGKLRLDVNGKSREFDISHVDSLWKMSFTIKDCFDFIQKTMRPSEDTRDVEYAAVNGMLSTLDPHSILLRPEMYREMKLTTKGEFGGLGFVIQMKEGNLTVVKVLPKTPAYRAGIKKDDQIRKIGEESTVNMDLNEAVSKLRGPVDSRVGITVERKGWEKPQAMVLTRALINIESVQSKLLSHNVGYVRLKNFQGNTTRHLQSALEGLAKEASPHGGIKGLVLDLRGNPGGLLEQAIQVSDLFLSKGSIVTTVGLSDKLREEKRAHGDESDKNYPVAVLVNAGSASASEIVAGALKNLNRAVVIGRQTFGKGSVQVLYDFQDESALKLTIAKYLTPGDISIQEVGIVPDIALVPTRVTKDRLDVFAPRKSSGEADLEQHFGNPESKAVAKKREDVIAKGGKSFEELKYLKEDTKQRDASARAQLVEEGKSPKLSKTDPGGAKKKHGEKDPLLDVDVSGSDEDLDDQLDAESQDEVKEDFEVLFARDFVLKAPFNDREKMLQAGKGFIHEREKEEEERIQHAIQALGVNWEAGPSPGSRAQAQLAATLKPGPDKKITAGDLLDLELTVENRGTEPVKRLRAWTESDNPFLDRREFVFGALEPGEKRSWKVPVRLPKDLTSRRDQVVAKLYDDNGMLSESAPSEMTFVELPRPAFAFNWQVNDSCEACNGDGLIQRGEEVELFLDVTNTGKGKALDSYAQIKNAGGENIFIDKGRFKLGELAPGETKTARFVLEVKRAYKDPTFPLKLAVVDEPIQEFTSEKLAVPVSEGAVAIEPKVKPTLVRVGEKAELLDAPDVGARVVARLPKGGLLPATGKSGDFLKVELDKGRFAFLRTADVRGASAASDSAGRGAKGKAPGGREIQFVMSRTPPQIALETDAQGGGLVVNGDHFTLSGTASDPHALLDVYVLVNDQKVNFTSGGPPKKEGAKIAFSTDFTLKEGNNYVMVVARETQDFGSRRALVIRRRPAPVAQQIPKP